MRQIGLLARQLPLELADQPRQFSPFVAQCTNDMRLRHARSLPHQLPSRE
jgi:hypothetical protein